MEEQESKNITVVIAGRPYSLKIKTNDEPALRRIVKELNDKVNQFQLTYTKKDKQDCLSMALLTYAVDLHKARLSQKTSSKAVISEKLDSLNDYLDKLVL